ncbi:hypothetical protein BOX15_Mlig030191g2 [Macrostomum lignano]|uniref:Uncharacterized protein n=2 Tax=Macrostomum lignano TaxID=282301 RepID=A0A267H2C2_9PLAT|nr:hypothetical protein BOX15_Mlig030191g2 [Macrostomum lignano]
MSNLEKLEELECHFTWLPEDGSTNTSIDEVIKKTERKIDRQPHKKSAHLTTLAYLYTRKRGKNFGLAHKCLEEALAIDEQIRRDKQEDVQVSSEFVIRANMLHLEQLRKGQNRTLKPAEIEPKMQRLNSLWSDSNSQARVYGVKGVTFDCFGPMKYPVGVVAFAEASRLQANNFNWLYGEAFLRARCDRQVVKKHADKAQLQLWSRAREIGERTGQTTNNATFYSNYAEAILYNRRLTELCCELTDRAVDILRRMSEEEKENSHVDMKICLKTYRHIKKISNLDCESRRKTLLEEAGKVAMMLKDPDFFLTIANEAEEAGDRDKAIELLERGKQLAGEPGHIWLNLRLLELQMQTLNKQQVIDEFVSMRESFGVYLKNVSAIEFHKALYLIKQGDTKEALESCVAALEADPKVDQVWFSKKKEFFLCLTQKTAGFEEYVAWFAANVGDFKEPVNIEPLFLQALNKDASNEFALEHLGRFYIKKGRLDNASGCFRKLPDHIECKYKLLAQSLLEDPNASFQKLQECLQCGCRDAVPKLLEFLEQRKASQNTAEIVINDVVSRSARDSLFFSTQLYELCAEMEATLQDPNRFWLREDNTESTNDPVELAKRRIAKFLELDQLMSTVASSRSCDGSGDRGNLMRSSRLRLTKQRLERGGKTQQQTQELNNLIVSVVKESKEVLDRSLVVLLSRCKKEAKDAKKLALSRKEKEKRSINIDHYYPHAFNKIKKQLGSDFQEKLNKLALDGKDTKAFERESLITYLKEGKKIQTQPGATATTNNSVSPENVRKCLSEAVAEIDPNFHQQKSTKDMFEFMARREHRILSQEDCWIVHWIYLVNSEKHSAEILVAELNEQLRSDWSGGGECNRTAYDVAHLAAEFAEETWAVFSCESRSVVPTGAHSTQVVACVGDSKNAEDVASNVTVTGGNVTGAGDATGLEDVTCAGVAASSVDHVSLYTSASNNPDERDNSRSYFGRGGIARGGSEHFRGRGGSEHFRGRGGSEHFRGRGGSEHFRGRGGSEHFRGRGSSERGGKYEHSRSDRTSSEATETGAKVRGEGRFANRED